MADPLSVAGGIVGILSLGIQVSSSLLDYYDAYRDRDETVVRISDRLEAMRNSLQLLDKTVQVRQFNSEETTVISAMNSSLLKSKEHISFLQKKCDKIRLSKAQSLTGSIMLAGSRIIYPLRKSTLEKLDENICAVQENLVLALNVLQLRDDQHLQDDVAEIKQLTKMISALQISADIRQWLNAPDPTINHNSNCSRRHPGTGTWFIQGPEFNAWLDQPNAFLWVTGFAGSGKSVLCSTAIQHTFRRKHASSHVAVAFFYFAFTDQRKQDTSAMLRALILQLSGQARNGISDLSSLYSTYKVGTPPTAVLMEYLHQIVGSFGQVYILLDALDEVPQGRGRRDMLNAIREMKDWLVPGLHLMVTSRDEVDIHERLPFGERITISQEVAGVDQDIAKYVEGQLKTDADLVKWKKHHDNIQQTLTNKACGVFRWVECQLESIKQCPRSVGQLEECLRTLPEDLDETYERILCSIKGQSSRDAKRVLMALSFSARPLTVPELIDLIAIDTNLCPCLNRDFRYEDADSLKKICPGLIQIYTPQMRHGSEWHQLRNIHGTSVPVVRIAHFSVQEYLESPRIRQQEAKEFALDKSVGHAEMTSICVSYLLEAELASKNMKSVDLEDLPLVDYAAQYWPNHYHQTTYKNGAVHGVVSRLFHSSDESFRNWIRLYDHERPRSKRCFELHDREIANPLYQASLLGMPVIVEELISTGRWKDAHGTSIGNALKVASRQGHGSVVRVLLDNGANVNAHGGLYNNPLGAASLGGHEQIVLTLLGRGADVNARGAGKWATALQAASLFGHTQVVQILLDHGAQVNTRAGKSSIAFTALHAAASGGHTQIAQILLDHGADINVSGGWDGSALKVATREGHSQVRQLLIQRGARDD